MQASMVLVIGHRGAKALAPENTLEGLRAAAKCGADWVEVDVRLSKDGVLVLMHDETVDRTTNGSGKVQDLCREDLSALSVLSVLDAGGQRIPSLGEAISLARELSLGLVVEMKEEGLEELVADSLRGSDSIVTSFYHASLREIKEISDLRTGIIISSLPVQPVQLALWARADAIFPRRCNPRLFKEAHRCGLKVYPWTINESEEAAWLLRLGADGLVTDDPCLIRKVADAPLRATGKGNCEYYPCHHFEDQDCTHCFCPLYPCRDKDLGRFVRTGRGKRVWTCIDCQLVHKPFVAKYLLENPEASTAELKALEKQI
jgi:glycerophosphoryl diester phosphodiesterase